MSEAVSIAVDPTANVPSERLDRHLCGAVSACVVRRALRAWQWGVRAFGVPEYILPVPTEFLAKLWTDKMP